jgi:hypothetical protein
MPPKSLPTQTTSIAQPSYFPVPTTEPSPWATDCYWIAIAIAILITAWKDRKP